MIRLCELNKDPAKYAGEVEIAGCAPCATARILAL